jgi:hypothetical protein
VKGRALTQTFQGALQSLLLANQLLLEFAELVVPRLAADRVLDHLDQVDQDWFFDFAKLTGDDIFDSLGPISPQLAHLHDDFIEDGTIPGASNKSLVKVPPDQMQKLSKPSLGTVHTIPIHLLAAAQLLQHLVDRQKGHLQLVAVVYQTLLVAANQVEHLAVLELAYVQAWQPVSLAD